MEEEVKPKRHYKIEAGDKIVVRRQQYEQYVFYKTEIKNNNPDGTESFRTKNLAFPKGTDIADGTTIIVKDFYEYGNPIKNNKFITNWSLYILEWEEVANYENAFGEYNNAKSEFDIDDLNQDDLPF